MRLARTTFHHATCRQATFLPFFIFENRHCCRRHLRAQTALHNHHLRRRHLQAQTVPFLGTTCMLVRGDSNLQPNSWSIPPLPLHQHITGTHDVY